MTQNTSLRNKAADWYLNLGLDANKRICAKHYPNTEFMDITWEQIETIYLKEHPTEAETVNNNIKGALNGLCYRTACQKPGAVYYNHSTRQHYCKDCAEMLNAVNREEAMMIYNHDLCTLVEDRPVVQDPTTYAKVIGAKELGDFSLGKPTNDNVSLRLIADKEIETIYLKEHSTEAEVSKEEETVEQYAKNYLKKLDDESGNMWTEDNEGIVKSFVHMANWQKEQDRVLIEDLLEIVNVLSATINPNDYTREFKSKVRNSITKAEQHLKNN